MDTLAHRVAARFVTASESPLAGDPDATRHRTASLDVGQSVFTEHLKIHRFHGSVRITDMTNAGKRGKKVRELIVVVHHHDEALADKILKQAITSVLHRNYDQAKTFLDTIIQDQHPGLFTLQETELRGVDVEPMGTTIKLEKKFPDGKIVRIKASPHDFHVMSSVPYSGGATGPKYTVDFDEKTDLWCVFNLANKAVSSWHDQHAADHDADQRNQMESEKAPFRQDTGYWPKSKKDGIIFYGWLKDNLSHAANMTMNELASEWDKLGVMYDSH